MDYEKAYKNALERAREELGSGCYNKGTIEYIFPELKESEDEKNIKNLIDELKCSLRAANCQNEACNGGHEKRIALLEWAIAWLEKQGNVSVNIDKMVRDYANNKEYGNEEFGKPLNCMIRAYRQGLIDVISTLNLKNQGEQKVPVNDFKAEDWYVSKVDGKIRNIYYSVDKVESKFHEGDWIVQENIGTYKVIEVCESWYEVVDAEDNHYSIEFDKEYMCHLWTIADAKLGDVLVSQYDKPFIYNGNFNSFNIGSYCGISVEDRFNVATEKCYWTQNANIHPATKEQRDLLFVKIKEAEYDWNEEKKELKKVEQKSVWSEEDKARANKTLYFLNRAKRFCVNTVELDACIDWIKSLEEKYKNNDYI